MACSRVNFTFTFISDGNKIYVFWQVSRTVKWSQGPWNAGAQSKHYPRTRLEAKPKSSRLPPLHHPHRSTSNGINTGFRGLLQSLMICPKNISRRPRLSHDSALLATHHTDTQWSTQYSSAPHTNISTLLTQHSLVIAITRFTNFPYTRCTNTAFSNLQSNFPL